MTAPVCTSASPRHACNEAEELRVFVGQHYKTRCGNFEVFILRAVGDSLVLGDVSRVSSNAPHEPVLCGPLYPGRFVSHRDQYFWSNDGRFSEEGPHAMDLVKVANR